MKLTDYKVITETSKKELEKQVNLLIKEGYIPQGGVNVVNITTIDDAQTIYAWQAMIKTVD